MRRLWLALSALLLAASFAVGWFGWPAVAVVSAQNGLIAFQSDRDGDAEIFTVAANGSALTQLTTNNTFDGEPSWSPDAVRSHSSVLGTARSRARASGR